MHNKIKQQLRFGYGSVLTAFMLLNCQSLFAADAATFDVYKHNINPLVFSSSVQALPAMNTLTHEYTANDNPISTKEVKVGGFGGNKGSGQLIYDGFYLPPLVMNRDEQTKTCYLYNNAVKVVDINTNQIVSFPCAETDRSHPGLYWNGDFDAVNGSYSPGNDALYAGTAITQMFNKWYKMPVIHTDDNLPRQITIKVYKSNVDNAFWYGFDLELGSGAQCYSFTSLAIISSMLASGFTDQHSGLSWDGQSGAIRWAFGSMTAEAVKYFVYHKNDWQIGPEIGRSGLSVISHYLDQPSKDCQGKSPGHWCHIDSASQYSGDLDARYACGVYEHAFYLLANSPGWNTKKAYDVMLQANTHYWNKGTGFVSGACDVIRAAKDFGYDQDAVRKAFTAVEIDTRHC